MSNRIDEKRRPGSKKGAARWLADRAMDKKRDRFGREAIGYGSVVLGAHRAVPDAFRELTEREVGASPRHVEVKAHASAGTFALAVACSMPPRRILAISSISASLMMSGGDMTQVL